MFFFNIIFFFYFFIEIVISDNNDSNSTDFNILEKLKLENHLNTILNFIQSGNKSKISKNCISDLIKYYHNNTANLKKIIEGSSKGFVDLNSFRSCINKDNDDHTFFTIYPNMSKIAKQNISRLDDSSEEHLWIFGICLLICDCDEKQVTYIFDEVNTLFLKPFEFYTHENITAIDYRKAKEIYTNPAYFVRYFCPFFFIMIQIIFLIFKIIPVKIFGCFLKRKYLKELDKKGKNQHENFDDLINMFSLSNQITLKIRKCFSISEIVEDLAYSEKSELFKEKEMTYLKGIKTLGIIFFIFGFNFIIIYNYPLILSGNEERKLYLRGRGTILFIFCFRLAPAIILSTSGYSLSYKFLNFLDKKLANIIPDGSLPLTNEENKNESTNDKSDEENSDSNIDKITEKMSQENNIESSEEKGSSTTNDEYYENTFGIKFYNKDIKKSTLNKIFKGQKVNESTLLSQIPTDKIPCYIYFNYFFRQIHKFVFLLWGISLLRYGFPILLVRIGNSPLMYYLFQTFFQKLRYSILNCVFVGNFIDLFKKNDNEKQQQYLPTKLFCIPISEFNYFIVCTILIFICYKKKFRLDIILAFLIIIFLAFKIVYITINLKDMNPGMFYTDTEYQRFFFNPIFNFDFFLIGMFFGIMNYVVQNSIEKKKSLIKERPYVKLPIILLKYTDYKKNKNVFRFIFIILLLLFSLLATPIFFIADFDRIIVKEEDKKPNIAFVVISLFDIELFVFSFHFVLLSSYISGRNLFYRIFNTKFSSYGMKLSYWLIFGMPTFTYLIIFMNEANLKLNFFIVIIYSAITLIYSGIFALLLFLFLEMPYKKLIKLYFNINSEINKLYLEKDDENNTVDSGIGLEDLNEKDLLDDDNDNNKKNNEDDDDVKDD